MLVLARKEAQSIVIDTTDGPIEVYMVRLTKKGGNKAMIGIDAPKSCRVLRKELIDGSRDDTSERTDGSRVA